MKEHRSIIGKLAIATFVSGLALGVIGIQFELNPTKGEAAMTRPPPLGQFTIRCTLSHQRADDPIVKPNQPGASHLHQFFGNTTTNASSTVTSLDSGGTTCSNKKDKAAYWVPELRVNGKPVPPDSMTIYYSSVGKDAKTVKTIPHGLKMIAGDMMATTPQPRSIVSWDCGKYGGPPPTVIPLTCANSKLEFQVYFPDCWNGKDLDSADHKSHVAYHLPSHVCPPGYPVSIPRIREIVRYSTKGGPGVILASGGNLTGHADFFNAWDPAELSRLVKTCINAKMHCSWTGNIQN